MKKFWEWLLSIFKPTTPAVGEPKPPAREPKSNPVWFVWFLERVGWTETTHDVQLSRGWKLTKWCKSYRTVVGKMFAWCGMSLATALDDNGYFYPVECEAAVSYAKYGTEIEWKKTGIPLGAIVVLRHANGSFHVCLASRMHTVQELTSSPSGVKRWFYGLGGNQDNAIKVKAFDLTSDSIHAVRWPIRKS